APLRRDRDRGLLPAEHLLPAVLRRAEGPGPRVLLFPRVDPAALPAGERRLLPPDDGRTAAPPLPGPLRIARLLRERKLHRALRSPPSADQPRVGPAGIPLLPPVPARKEGPVRPRGGRGPRADRGRGPPPDGLLHVPRLRLHRARRVPDRARRPP